MLQPISIRGVQAALAATYGMLGIAAFLKAPSPVAALCAAVMFLVAYMASRVLPDVGVLAETAFSGSRLALLVIGAGAATVTWGGSKALSWAIVVMAYGAGNRLKAAGIMRPRRNRS